MNSLIKKFASALVGILICFTLSSCAHYHSHHGKFHRKYHSSNNKKECAFKNKKKYRNKDKKDCKKCAQAPDGSEKKKN